MIISGNIKIKKTVIDQKSFLIDKYFSMETGSYTEEDIELIPGQVINYAPVKGILVFCDAPFTMEFGSIEFTIDKFYSCFSDIPVIIKNTGDSNLKFIIITL